MTNREKFLNKILALHLLQDYSESDLSTEFGVNYNENDSITYDDIMKWLQSEYEEPKEPKEPEIEYIEVTNDIPRFTEIEVRNSMEKEWIAREFILVLKNKKNYPYITLSGNGIDVEVWKYARIRKDWENQ